MIRLALALTFLGAVVGIALGVALYMAIRGEYLQLPTDKPGSEVDALSRLMGSFARFSVRSRRMIRALVVAVMLAFISSAGFGVLAVGFFHQQAELKAQQRTQATQAAELKKVVATLEAQRCEPYVILNKANSGNRHLWTFILTRTGQSKTNPPNPQVLQSFEAELAQDYPNVTCPKDGG